MIEARKMKEVTPVWSDVPVMVSDGALMGLGVSLVVLGMIAVGYATFSTLVSVMVIGGLFLVGGIIQTISALYNRKKGGVFLHLLGGILFAFAGFLILTSPATSAAGLTLLMAACFIFGGVYRAIFAVVERWPAWGWFVFSGIVSVILGLMISVSWPVSAFWVLGTFLGIELLLTGWSLVAVALALQRAARTPVTP